MDRITVFKEFKEALTGLEQQQKNNIIIVSLVMFSLLFSYPIVRSATDAIFLNTYGAYKSPLVWLYSVVAISIFVWLYDFWQKKWSVKKIHLITGIFSCLMILFSNYMINSGFKPFAYVMYVWKEAYIVLLIHLSLAFFNNSIDLKVAKIVYGPLGAIGSIGGILGGIATSKLVSLVGMDSLVSIGAVIVFLSSVIFYFTNSNNEKTAPVKKSNSQKSVLKSIGNVKFYVLTIASIVMMSQFSINLLNYKLNIYVASEIISKKSQTEYFGMLYSLVNASSLVLQIFVIPFLFKYVKLSKTHALIPVSYIAIFWGGQLILAGNLLPVAVAFVCYKGCDYSLFNAAKELLYFNLNSEQKYGAKYIVDMLVYRISKGVISLGLIFVKSVQLVDILLTISLGIWLALLTFIFKKNKEFNQYRS